MNRGDLIEIQGPSGSGKTELLYFFTLKTILPQEVSLDSILGEEGAQSLVLEGRNKSVVVCDCDGRWSVTRLKDVLLQMLQEKVRDNFPEVALDADEVHNELSTIAFEALSHLHVFHPTSSASLAATLLSLPQYHYTKMPDEEICMLMIDGGLSSFYWEDRWNLELVGGRTTRDGVQQSPATRVVQALISFRQSHSPITFITTRALFPFPNTPRLFKQHIPPPFPAPFETRPDGTTNARISPLEITHHITLCNPNQSPISDHEELPPEDEAESEARINRAMLQVDGIMRTPARDMPESTVAYFSFTLAEPGVTARPIEEIMEMEGLSPIDASAPEY